MVFGRGLRTLSFLTFLTLTATFALAFFVAPLDADQGFIQKIFYVHVPMAIVALGGFVAGGVYAARFLRTGDRADDLRSYVAIHQSIILAVGVLATGMIWARASWGKWWVWEEPMLVAFLIVFLLFAVYQPLRFSIEDADRQARFAAVFAVIGAVFTPLVFFAVRQAESIVHPETGSFTTGAMPAGARGTFLLGLVAMTLLFVTLWKYELASKNATATLRRLKKRLAGPVDEGDDVLGGGPGAHPAGASLAGSAS